MTAYQVALSFAGEQRPLVSAVAELLASALDRNQIFYDRYHEAELARPNLDVYLQEIYHDRSRLVVVFLGADYEHKEWCGLEWRAVRDLIKRKSSERIMLIRVDDGAVAGVFGIDGWLDARGKSAAEIADRILERLRLRDTSPGSAKPRSDPPIPSGVTAVPSPPPHYLPRPEALAALKTKLLAAGTARLGITSPRKAVGVQGMGGIGKSVLAAALAQDAEVKAAFPEGVFWVAVGQQPDLIRFQVELTVAAGEPRPVLESPYQGKLLLSRLFAERAVLLVLDDVWNLDHAAELNVLGPRGRLLITTRDAELLIGLAAEEFRVEVLDLEAALALLADWAGQEVKDLPVEATQVAHECGYLPLALAMIGAMVRLRPTAWADALDRLARADLGKIRRNFPDYPYPDLLRAIEVSVEALEPEERERYLELAVFPEEAAIPESTLETLWAAAGLPGADARDLAAKLIARSLAQRDSNGSLRLHDLQADYLRHEVGDLGSLHSRLVAAYAARCPEGFAHGPNDGYFFQHLASHLVGAGRFTELRDLLLSYRWLETKLGATDINALISEYDTLSEDSELHLVQGALRLSAHALAEAPEELPGQLHGRLLGRSEASLIQLHARSRPSRSGPWLRPVTSSLTTSGGRLLQILTGHSDRVNAMVTLPDGRIISASRDRTVKVWDIVSGKTLQTLYGHAAGVTALAVLSAKRIVSASKGAIRIWDLGTGQTIQTFIEKTVKIHAVEALPDGHVVVACGDRTLRVLDPISGKTLRRLRHSAGLYSMAVLPDGRVVSASRGSNLQIWDIASGSVLQTLEGHSARVRAVAVLSDGRIVSASQDCTLRIWDLESGKTIQILRGHTGWIRAVAELPNRHIISASQDSTLRIWDLESGKTLQILGGHAGWVLAVAVLLDGRVVSSSNDGTLRVWDVDLLAGRATMSSGAARGNFDTRREGLTRVRAVAALPHRRVISASQDGTLSVWDIGSGKIIFPPLEGHTAGVTAVATLPNGRVVSASFDCTIRVWDLESQKILQTLRGHSQGVSAVAVMPNGHIISASQDGTLRAWDIDRGETLKIFKGHSRGVSSVVVTADGRIVSASKDHTLRVWDVNSGKTLKLLEGHSDGINSLTLTPEGHVVSASRDFSLRVWQVDSGQTITTLNGHSDWIHAVTVLPDCYIISASRDRTVRIWDLKTGGTVARLTLDAPPTSLAVLADDGRFVVADGTGRVFVLSLESAE